MKLDLWFSDRILGLSAVLSDLKEHVVQQVRCKNIYSGADPLRGFKKK